MTMTIRTNVRVRVAMGLTALVGTYWRTRCAVDKLIERLGKGRGT
jgi:hypothetical protein